jgi:hypothetical protein
MNSSVGLRASHRRETAIDPDLQIMLAYSYEHVVGGKCWPRVPPVSSPHLPGGYTHNGHAYKWKQRLSAAETEKHIGKAYQNATKLAWFATRDLSSLITLSLNNS